MDPSQTPTRPLLIEPHFLPSLSWMVLVSRYPVVYLDVSANYQKGSYRNRAHIPGPNGILRLSVPLEHGRGQKITMRAVKIAYAENWQKVMWWTITSSYRRSPYFDYFEDLFEPLFVRQFTYLIDMHMAMLSAIRKCLPLQIEFRFTDAYITTGAPGFDDLRGVINPAIHNPLHLHWKPYTQVFSDRHAFQPDMSILDAIFNKGKFTIQDLIQ